MEDEIKKTINEILTEVLAEKLETIHGNASVYVAVMGALEPESVDTMGSMVKTRNQGQVKNPNESLKI